MLVVDSRFGEPTLPLVALANSESRTCCGVASGASWRWSAAAPAVCGTAIDVPLIAFVAESLVYVAEVMPTPGANRSRQAP